MKNLLLMSLALLVAACSEPVTPTEPVAAPAAETVVEPAPEVAMPEPATPPYEPIAFVGQTATDAERELCIAAGGEIVPSGKLQWENCVLPFADAGKACSGETDCIGECRYAGEEVPPGTAVAGTCQATDAKFGCRTVVEGGLIAHTLCVD